MHRDEGEDAMAEPAVREIEGTEARSLAQERPEGSYTLLDVRQPHEYEAQHLPGARLIPLPDLEARIGEMDPSLPVIAYCRSGNRSRVAAQMLAQRGFKEAYSIRGGLMGWPGSVASGWPRTEMFTGGEDIVTALNLVFFMERGSEGFYQGVAERLGDPEARRLCIEIAAAERKHMRRTYERLARVRPELPTFEEYYELAESELMEGGLEPSDYAPVLERMSFQDAPHILETAIELEGRSLDLYRNLAAKAQDKSVSEMLLAISDEEKAHLRALAEKLGEMLSGQEG